MTDIRLEAREALDHREVWFIFSPRSEPWANIRIATFTKAMNRPHEELVVIHNEVQPRMGIRVWRDIVETEGWFKVRKIEVPTAEEVRSAMQSAISEADEVIWSETDEKWFQSVQLKKP